MSNITRHAYYSYDKLLNKNEWETYCGEEPLYDFEYTLWSQVNCECCLLIGKIEWPEGNEHIEKSLFQISIDQLIFGEN